MTSTSSRTANIRRAVPRKGRQLVNWRPSRPGQAYLDLTALVAPFRYDVIVRAQFFDFLSSHAADSDTRLVRCAEDEPYDTWFRTVECARFFPRLLADDRARRERFRRRVLGARALLRSFEDNGFDPTHPIGLLVGGPGGSTDSDLPDSATYHLGDGCHRVALLLRAGCTLEPTMYRLRRTRAPSIDNTIRLVRSLDVGEAEYARFLSPAFSGKPMHSISAIRRALVANDPDRVGDFDRIVAAHMH